MPIRNTYNTYGSISKFFHWLIAILILLMLSIGVSFSYLPKGDFSSFLMQIHKSLGVTIAILMVLRLFWRFTNQRPALPFNMPKWQVIFARWSHILLYIAVFLMPITGMIMSLSAGYPVTVWWIWTIKLAWIPQSKPLSYFMADLHEFFAWTLSVLIVIHVLAALKHHFINRDNVLKSMWPSRKKEKSLFH